MRSCRARGPLAVGAAFTAVAVVTMMVGTPRPVTAQGAGTLEVDVKYSGPPQIEMVKVTRDRQRCGTEIAVEKVVVGPNRGLAHAVVSVPSAQGGPMRRKAVVDQQGCRFVPHVTAMNPGDLELRNSDGILHDVHTYSTANPSINRPQAKSRKVMTEKLEKPEIVKLTCDIHTWMLGWVAVLPTAYFGVTDESGAVRLDGVPAGTQTVEVWHEALGRQAKDVDVKVGQTTKVTFEMRK